MFEKIKMNGFRVIFVFGLLSICKLCSFNLSRDYLVSAETFPEFKKKTFLDTRSFLSSSQNLNDERVVDPWSSFKLVNFNYNLQRYNNFLQKTPKNYLAKDSLVKVLKTSPDRLNIDVLIDRVTLGQDFRFKFLVKDIFANHDFSRWSGRMTEINKKRFSEVDLFFDANISFLNIKTTAEYELSPHSYANLVDPEDEDFLKNKNFTKENIMRDIEEARRKLQDSLGLNSYYANQTGPTDLNLTIGLKKNLRYFFNCNRFEFFGGLNITLPTGVKRNIDEAMSINFGKTKTCFGFLGGLNVLLKRDFALGLSFVRDFSYKQKTLERVAISEEPYFLSPVKENILTYVNSTKSFSGYLLFKNLIVDKIDFRVKYLNVSHDEDWTYPTEPLAFQVKSLRDFNTGRNVDGSTVSEIERKSSFYFSRLDFSFTWKPGSVAEREEDLYSVYFDVYYPLGGTRSLASRGIGFGGSIRF